MYYISLYPEMEKLKDGVTEIYRDNSVFMGG